MSYPANILLRLAKEAIETHKKGMQVGLPTVKVDANMLVSALERRIGCPIEPKSKVGIGRRYQHQKGSIYWVIAVANEQSDRQQYPTTIVYCDEEGRVWAKTEEDFLEKMRRVR